MLPLSSRLPTNSVSVCLVRDASSLDGENVRLEEQVTNVIFTSTSHLHVITSSPGKAPAISLKFLRMKLSLSKIDSDYTTQHRYE